MRSTRLIFLKCIIFLVAFQLSIAQQELEKLHNSYAAYNNNPRELTYAHLNKSIYIKGETLGFSSYVVDKKNKKASLETSNLYCVVEDTNQNIIKSKLIRIENGVGNGTINIDSLFNNGQYIFKAYTNWQKNFEEQNFYTQTFEVIDVDNKKVKNTSAIETKIDVQFLPEGGHAVYGVNNTFGVVIKNSLGLGISNINGKILDSKNNNVSNFKVNSLGIGRFSFVPLANEKYTAKLNINDKDYDYKLDNFKLKGIVLNLKSNSSKLYALLKTNKKTLSDIKGKKFYLAIHNGEVLKTIAVNFSEEREIIKLIKLSDLNTGINIFTLLDVNNKPILERLFFNYNGINKIANSEVSINKAKDTALVSLQFDASHFSKFNNISVSVLPKKTKSYNHHHNIISYLFLQPYLKNYIENAQYYFTNINAKKKYHLDNLLLTQGWSSYNWFNVFNNPPKVNYIFEKGVYYKATVNNSKSKEFIMYPTKNNSSSVFNTTTENNQFELRNFFPINNEELNIAEFNKKGNITPPSLYIQFYPSVIPSINNKVNLLASKYNYSDFKTYNNTFLSSNLDNVQELGEIVLEASKRDVRLEKLQRTSWGKIDIWDDEKRERTPTILAYLSSYFSTGTDSQGRPFIISRNPNTLSGSVTPLLFLNDIPLQGLDQLITLPMEIIDYVEINKSGIGEGIRGGAGVIKIYTDPYKFTNNSGDGRTYRSYKIPITFSDDKKFYKPVYVSYSSDFYSNFGVLEWLPKIKVNNKGLATFKMKIPKINDFKLFIEGLTDDGHYISEIKAISLN